MSKSLQGLQAVFYVALILALASALAGSSALAHPLEDITWQDAGDAGNWSAAIPTDRIDAYIARQMKAYHIPGAALAIVRDGQLVYQRGYGMANQQGQAVTPETPFLLASVSKSFTALAVMQLVEAGKLDLKAPVREYLPWFDVAGGGEAITIEQLLYQSSGLSELDGVKAILQPDSPQALELGVRRLASIRLKAPPGSQWDYSNLNYDVLGLLIQKVSGQAYETYIQDHIFTPLSMSHSYSSMAEARAGGAASGYVQFFGLPLPYDRWMPYSRATLPAAGLWSSATDLSHYLIALLDGGRYGDFELLSPAGIQEMHRPGIRLPNGSGYAMGWFYWPGFLDRRYQPAEGPNYTHLATLFHDGDWANYKAVVLMLPDLDYGMALLMNSNDMTIRSAYTFFAWDLTMIATGGQPQYFGPDEDFLLRYSRWIGAGLVLILLVRMAFMLRTLRRVSHPPADGADHPGRMLGLAVLFQGVDLALVGFFFLFVLPRHDVVFPVLLRTMPDLGLVSLLALLLALVWGPLRSLLFLRAWSSARNVPRVQN